MTMANENGPPVPDWTRAPDYQPTLLDTDAVVIETLRANVQDLQTSLDAASYAVAELKSFNDALRQELADMVCRYNDTIRQLRAEYAEANQARARIASERNVVWLLLRQIYQSMEWKPEAEEVTIDHGRLLMWLVQMRELLAIIDARKDQ